MRKAIVVMSLFVAGLTGYAFAQAPASLQRDAVCREDGPGWMRQQPPSAARTGFVSVCARGVLVNAEGMTIVAQDDDGRWTYALTGNVTLTVPAKR